MHEILSFRDALSYASECSIKMIPYELAEDFDRTKAILEKISAGDSIAVFIGPEGGFAEEEIEAAKEAGAKIITLGKRILRTETVALMIMSIFNYLFEED